MVRKEDFTSLHKQIEHYMLPDHEEEEVYSRRSNIFKAQVRVEPDIPDSFSTLYLMLSSYTKYNLCRALLLFFTVWFFSTQWSYFYPSIGEGVFVDDPEVGGPGMEATLG